MLLKNDPIVADLGRWKQQGSDRAANRGIRYRMLLNSEARILNGRMYHKCMHCPGRGVREMWSRGERE